QSLLRSAGRASSHDPLRRKANSDPASHANAARAPLSQTANASATHALILPHPPRRQALRAPARAREAARHRRGGWLAEAPRDALAPFRLGSPPGGRQWARAAAQSVFKNSRSAYLSACDRSAPK